MEKEINRTQRKNRGGTIAQTILDIVLVVLPLVFVTVWTLCSLNAEPKIIYWPILAADVIQLGRLQFQKINSPYDFPGLGIQEGELLMNIHIPALGPLDIEACRESLRRAEELFVPMFGEFKAFFCHSWLLNPVYRRYLPPTSNIIRFQNLGTVIPFHNSLDRDAPYRVFLNYHEDPFTSKPRSAMQRAVQQMILRGESLSAACMLIMR